MGLIQRSIADTGLKPFNPAGQLTEAKSVGYDEKLGVVDLDTDTVSGQLDKILSQDNPYVARARASAAGVANSRGLLNSTMGAQAGEAAAIDAALPIATQDANIYSQQRLTNQQAENVAGQFGAAAANQAGVVNAGAANQIAGQQLAGEQQIGAIQATGGQQRETQTLQGQQVTALTEQKAQIDQALLASEGTQKETLQAQKGVIDNQLQVLKASQDMALQGLRGTQAETLANIEGKYRELLQASAAASALYTNIARGITDILSNNDLTPESKQAAIDMHINFIESGLAVVGGLADIQPPLTSLLRFA